MNETEVVESLLEARRRLQRYEPPTQRFAGLDLATAYRLQREFVERSGETIAGYKGAVTAPAAQQAMGLQQPASGVLFLSGSQTSGCRLEQSQFRTPAVEAEIGFRIGQTIAAPIELSAVGGVIRAAMPMAEFADPGLTRPFEGVDLIATNCASAHYLVGPEIDEGIDVDGLQATISRNGETLGGALAGSVLGGQQQALHWLINVIVGLGYTIKPGDLMMTGAIGQPFPGVAGDYEIDFGPAGRLTFAIV